MRQKGILIGLLFLLLLSTSVVLAQVDGGFELFWWSVDGGGGHSTGGPFELTGSIGQSDPGDVLQGGNYAVVGGFLSVDKSMSSVPYEIFLPTIQN